ncbi:hypothetical protein KEF85_05535 [Methylomonas paludis]|uniref:Uncharacterized protein n=1 Tax=Methylomonas paludis TaxID=1173101 RepID=A0A975MQ84_9GAMM|nr:hypothetical protein [Methylomonas paludis]QWF71920.1 hypothetical protein KEF85_05535 [Methylomonas paludis]
MKAAIEQYVDREASYQREKCEDMERWQRYQLTGLAIPNETVDPWLSSWGNDSELLC